MVSPDLQTTCYFSFILDLDMQAISWNQLIIYSMSFFFYQLEANEFLQSILINGSSKIDAFYAFFYTCFWQIHLSKHLKFKMCLT